MEDEKNVFEQFGNFIYKNSYEEEIKWKILRNFHYHIQNRNQHILLFSEQMHII